MEKNPKKLDFLIAGMQKSATTALNHFLKQHQQIFLPSQKELHFFDNENLNWHDPSYGDFHKWYKDAPNDQLWGEATPVYTYWEPALFRIFQYNPSIKLIVMLKDPVARAYSHWRMQISKEEEELDFAAAIRSGRKRVFENADVNSLNKAFSYVERGFYAPQIERLKFYFPDEQLLFLKSFDLAHKFETTLQQVTEFLGIEEFITPPQKAFIRPFKNKETVPEIHPDDISYLRRLYTSDQYITEQLLSFTIPNEV